MGFFSHLIQLIMSPGHGWEDIEQAEVPAGEAASRGFYPLTALAALSVFVHWLWTPVATLPGLLTEAIVTFVMFFAGYFVGALALSSLLPRRVYEPQGMDAAQADTWKCHTFAMYSIALLELITLVQNCVPITLSITLFLPLGVALVMWKGRNFMDVPSERTPAFMLIAVGGVLVPPYLIQLLLHWLLPAA